MAIENCAPGSASCDPASVSAQFGNCRHALVIAAHWESQGSRRGPGTFAHSPDQGSTAGRTLRGQGLLAVVRRSLRCFIPVFPFPPPKRETADFEHGGDDPKHWLDALLPEPPSAGSCVIQCTEATEVAADPAAVFHWLPGGFGLFATFLLQHQSSSAAQARAWSTRARIACPVSERIAARETTGAVDYPTEHCH